MQISDLVGQYNQAQSAGSEQISGTKGVENLVSSLKSLTKGNIFEGTVSSMKNGRVTLALSNGSQVSARLDGKVALTEGQSMFFQVKSNDGTTIAIRPFVVDGNGVNYTLMQALSAAGLPADASYLSMVDKMMEEQMPIDKGSLQQMARLVGANGNIDVRTLVEMTKLGIEITPENAAQFENYLGDKQAITDAINSLIDELPMAMQGSGLSDEGLRQMNAQMLSVITEGLGPESAEAAAAQETEGAAVSGQETASQAPGQTVILEEPGAAVFVKAEGQAVPEGEASPQAEAPMEDNPLMRAAAATAEGVEFVMEEPSGNSQAAFSQAGEAVKSVNPETAAAQTEEGIPQAGEAATQQTEGAVPQKGEAAAQQTETAVSQRSEAPQQTADQTGTVPQAAAHTLESVLDSRQLTVLNDMLKELVGQDGLHYDGNQSVSGLLRNLQGLLDSNLPVDRDRLQQLLSSGEFKALVKDTLEQQWTVKPQELTGSDKINKLYEKLEAHMDRIGDVLKATGQESANFTQTAADIRSNVDFMNQINQAYSYVQIPLKMSGQTASGQLYVYTNKKALAEGDRELSAFLHLDMDNLGPTDISVKLLNREVSTNFYLENDEAYAIIEANLPILQARLKEKGYNCKATVINESHHVNFVEDFLKKDMPSAGQLHRYSFDMRA